MVVALGKPFADDGRCAGLGIWGIFGGFYMFEISASPYQNFVP